MASPGWAALKPGPRALYLELKRRFNGRNNGKLFLSHRDAVESLGMNRKDIGTYFAELVDKGFIVPTQGHCLGPSGKGQATTYALTEERCDNEPATMDFMACGKQNPRRKTRHMAVQMSENPESSGLIQPYTVSENPATYIEIPDGGPDRRT